MFENIFGRVTFIINKSSMRIKYVHAKQTKKYLNTLILNHIWESTLSFGIFLNIIIIIKRGTVF